ncbi:hypothetical protein Btru_042548 [Bulinus truncatus]|nr:hypothetical protein Btru_042548 [Bulinus truncatus]
MLQLLFLLTAVVGVSTAATAEALTDEVINAFLEVHNVARGEVSVPPLIWNQTISDYASAYASNCVFKHSTGPYGENIYASSPVADNAIVARRAVKMWNDEKVNVDLPNWNCFARSDKTCGHYSQMTKVNKLLRDLPLDSSVVITSADTMLRELFSHRGSGTFFRSAEAVHRYTSLDGIDLDRLRSFLKSLTDTYFKEISNEIHAVYLSESYSGVAIILKSPTQVPYMCKFAVTNKAQGQGTGEMLWDKLIRSEPSLFWRSKTDNPINTWYFKKCEGSYNNRMWLVFWYGVSDPNLSAGLIKDALRRTESFVPKGIINIPSDDEEERMGG